MAVFGELLANLRTTQRLTQRELADVLYVTPGTISNYEKGVHMPDAEKLIAIADYFRVSIDYLMGRVPVNLPPDVLRRSFTEDSTLGEVLEMLQPMSDERKRTLLLIVRDMVVSAAVDKLRPLK